MVNYFNYSYENNDNEDISVFSEIGIATWNSSNYVLQVTMKSKDIFYDENRANNFVFLLDVSGSMNSFNNSFMILYHQFKFSQKRKRR